MDVRRRDAGDPRGLADRQRSALREPLARFGRQAGDPRVIDVRADVARLEAPQALDVARLAGDVARILDLGFDFGELAGRETERGQLGRRRQIDDRVLGSP